MEIKVFKEIIRYRVDKNNVCVGIGQNIRGLREAANIKQSELALMIGLSRTSVVNIELGRQNIVPHQIYSLCLALNCKVTDILPEAKKP